jgi:hypothetical protein
LHRWKEGRKQDPEGWKSKQDFPSLIHMGRMEKKYEKRNDSENKERQGNKTGYI